MKKYFVLGVIGILIININFAQQLVRGYSAGFEIGLLKKGEDFNFRFEGDLYAANPVSAMSTSIFLSLPFDIGYKRHRFVVTPGTDFLTTSYVYTTTPIISGAGFDTLNLNSFIIIPLIGIAYKYHFYTGRVHYALGFGFNAKLPVYREMKLQNNNKYEMINYDGKIDPTEESYLDFDNSSVHLALWKTGSHIVPMFLFVVYVSKFFITNFSIKPFIIPSKSIQGVAFALGASYMIPTSKRENMDYLQLYKQK